MDKYLYEAQKDYWDNKVKIIQYLIIKETPKLYKCKVIYEDGDYGYTSQVRKENLGRKRFSKIEALQVLKDILTENNKNMANKMVKNKATIEQIEKMLKVEIP